MYEPKIASVEEPLVHVLHEEPLLRERVLRTSVLQIDELVGGFRSSEVSLLDSDNDYASTLLHLLCINAINQFDEDIVWIDGGNIVNPYAIGSLCKRMRIDKREILSRVNISRAFTAYQLVTLIDEKLEGQVQKIGPSTIIISSITELFLDKDMKWMESHQLFRRCIEDVSKITKEHETVSLLTNRTHYGLRPSPGLDGLLYESSNVVVQLRARRGGMMVRLPKVAREILFSSVPWNQATLDEYRGDLNGKDGAYIPLGT